VLNWERSVATGLAIVEGEVRELVRRRGIDPVAEPAVVRRLIDEVITHYLDRAVTSSLPPLGDTTQIARAVLDAVSGFGPLQPFLDDPSIEEVWINEPGRVFIARRGRSELTTLILTAEQEIAVAEAAAQGAGEGTIGLWNARAFIQATEELIRLNVENWTLVANRAFLDAAIARGAIFQILSDISAEAVISEEYGFSVFGRELAYLAEAGYKILGNLLIP